MPPLVSEHAPPWWGQPLTRAMLSGIALCSLQALLQRGRQRCNGPLEQSTSLSMLCTSAGREARWHHVHMIQVVEVLCSIPQEIRWGSRCWTAPGELTLTACG